MERKCGKSETSWEPAAVGQVGTLVAEAGWRQEEAEGGREEAGGGREWVLRMISRFLA